MHAETTSRAELGRWALAGWAALAGTGTGTSRRESSSSGDRPTSTNPTATTEGGMTDGIASATSPDFRLRGGLVGANGSPP
jgi:hypothetical protein